MQQLVDNVVGAHGQRADLDRTGRRQNGPKGQGVEGNDTIDRGVSARHPHTRCQRGRCVEAGRQHQISPLLRRMEPAPSGGHVAVQRDAGGDRHVLDGRHPREVERAILCDELADGEKHPRAGTHLGVVGCERQIPARSGEEVGDSARAGRALAETGADTGDLGDDLRPRMGHRW